MIARTGSNSRFPSRLFVQRNDCQSNTMKIVLTTENGATGKYCSTDKNGVESQQWRLKRRRQQSSWDAKEGNREKSLVADYSFPEGYSSVRWSHLSLPNPTKGSLLLGITSHFQWFPAYICSFLPLSRCQSHHRCRRHHGLEEKMWREE